MLLDKELLSTTHLSENDPSQLAKQFISLAKVQI